MPVADRPHAVSRLTQAAQLLRALVVCGCLLILWTAGSRAWHALAVHSVSGTAAPPAAPALATAPAVTNAVPRPVLPPADGENCQTIHDAIGAIDEESLTAAMRALRINDAVGFQQLQRSGRCQLLPAGTRCLMLDRGFFTCEVRLDRSGVAVVVPREAFQ